MPVFFFLPYLYLLFTEMRLSMWVIGWIWRLTFGALNEGSFGPETRFGRAFLIDTHSESIESKFFIVINFAIKLNNIIRTVRNKWLIPCRRNINYGKPLECQADILAVELKLMETC